MFQQILKNINGNKYFKILFIIIFSVLLTLFLETYITILENSFLINNFSLILEYISMKETIVLFLLSFLLFWIIFHKELRNKVIIFSYKYRFLIAGIVFILSILFEIHGSSLAELNLANIKHNSLLGIPRTIRGDEYNVNTMLAFSQYFTDFSYFNDIVRATPTDMFLIYGQPVWDIGVLLRPSHWGYLLLSPAKGLSFFWMGRLIALFLISFEMGMLISKKNKTLALAYAFLITFSPIVQWWFAINGLVEQLIFGQLGIILLNIYMTINDYKKRLLIGLSFVIIIGGYFLTFYPSWQIPLAYVFLILAIWVILERYKTFKYSKKDLGIIILVFLILGIIALSILSKSFETLKIILRTAYPSGESFLGGGMPHYFFNYVGTIFYPLSQENLIPNVCENAVFYDFFPLPLVLFTIVTFIQKKKDKLLIGLIAIYIFLGAYYLFIWPEFLAKITILSHVKPSREFLAVGLTSILILIRSMTLLKNISNKKLIILLSFLMSIAVVLVSTNYFEEYYMKWMILIMIIVSTISFSTILLSASKKGKTIFLALCILISFSAGGLVNPVESGIDVLEDQPYLIEVEKIVNNDSDGKWITENAGINTLISKGAPTINSINVYPQLDTWHKIDENKEYEDIYNRYAHIIIIIQNETNTSFVLENPDAFTIYLNVDDLKTLEIKYILTASDLEKFSNEKISFERIYSDELLKIYKVEYT